MGIEKFPHNPNGVMYIVVSFVQKWQKKKYLSSATRRSWGLGKTVERILNWLGNFKPNGILVSESDLMCCGRIPGGDVRVNIVNW